MLVARSWLRCWCVMNDVLRVIDPFDFYIMIMVMPMMMTVVAMTMAVTIGKSQRRTQQTNCNQTCHSEHKNRLLWKSNSVAN